MFPRDMDPLDLKNEIRFFRHPDKLIFLNRSPFETRYWVTQNGVRFVLSVLRQSDLPAVAEKAGFLKTLEESGVPTHRIIAFGSCRDPDCCYAVCNWIDGEPLDRVLQRQNALQRQQTGEQCGRLLRRVHSHTASPEPVPELPAAIADCLRQKERYLEFGKEFPCTGRFLEILEQYGQKTWSPGDTAVLHGDFKPDNIISRPDGLYLIDWVYGKKQDTVKDFVRNLANAAVSGAYAKGLIDGYFAGALPEGFWEKLFVYSAMHQLELLTWIGSFDFVTPAFVKRQHGCMMAQYDDLNLTVPLYYRKEISHES